MAQRRPRWLCSSQKDREGTKQNDLERAALNDDNIIINYFIIHYLKDVTFNHELVPPRAEIESLENQSISYLEDIAEIGILSVRQVLKGMGIIIIHCLLNTSLRQLILLPVLSN
jgi:hypothetical protein